MALGIEEAKANPTLFLLLRAIMLVGENRMTFACYKKSSRECLWLGTGDQVAAGVSLLGKPVAQGVRPHGRPCWLSRETLRGWKQNESYEVSNGGFGFAKMVTFFYF